MNAPLPSNRSFGAVFVAFFGLVAFYAWWKSLGWVALPASASLLVLAVTLSKPALLSPFNRAWMALATVLHRIVSPIVLGVIFYGMFAPFGWVMRWAGRDALKRRFEPDSTTYWIERQPPGPAPDDLRNQF